jgi:CheY-like chemotaxis protein
MRSHWLNLPRRLSARRPLEAIRVAGDAVLADADALGGAIPLLGLGRLAVELHQPGVIHVIAEGFLNAPPRSGVDVSPAPAAINPAPGGLTGDHTATILIVEDETIVAMALKHVVRDAGHFIFGSVAKGGRAIDLLAKGRPDAALLDIRLSYGEVVYPVADRLAAIGVPFALMTGYATQEIEARFASCVVLHKPFSEGSVRATIKRLLGEPSAEGP